MNDIERLKFVVQDRDRLCEEDFQAIENVLKELEEKEKLLEQTELMRKEASIENLKIRDELKIYKDITEKISGATEKIIMTLKENESKRNMTREERALKLTEIWANHRATLGQSRMADDMVDNYNYNLKYMRGN